MKKLFILAVLTLSFTDSFASDKKSINDVDQAYNKSLSDRRESSKKKWLNFFCNSEEIDILSKLEFSLLYKHAFEKSIILNKEEILILQKYLNERADMFRLSEDNIFFNIWCMFEKREIEILRLIISKINHTENCSNFSEINKHHKAKTQIISKL